ncbi:MAG: ABC transporter substrate-binding protein [bacterium]
MRFRFIIPIFCITILCLLTGCRNNQVLNKTSITYWTGWSGHELEIQRKLINRFNETHPNIQVNIFSVAGSYEKVKIAFAAGDPPDVCSAIWADDLAGYAMRGALIPLDNYLQKSGRKAEEYMPGIWDMFQYNGHTWALNVTTNSRFIIYNRDAFKQSGLDPNRPPETIAELDAYTAKLAQFDPQGNVIRFGYRPETISWWGYVFGGRFYDPKTKTVTANDPKNVAALRWLASYGKKYDLRKVDSFRSTFNNITYANTYGGFYGLFAGKIGMMPAGEWCEQFINRYSKNFHYGYFPAPVPPGGRKNTVTVGGSVFVIPKDSKHPDQAWELLNWLTQPEQVKEFCVGIDNIPPLKVVAQMPEFTNRPIFKFATELVGGPNAFGPPQMPIWTEYLTELGRAEDYAIHGKGDPKLLLDEVTIKIQKSLDEALQYAKY